MWTERDNRLIREFRFKDFQEAFTFMTRVAFFSESHAHHPTMVNTFSYVRIELHTHDAGGVVTRRITNWRATSTRCCNREKFSRTVASTNEDKNERHKKAPRRVPFQFG